MAKLSKADRAAENLSIQKTISELVEQKRADEQERPEGWIDPSQPAHMVELIIKNFPEQDRRGFVETVSKIIRAEIGSYIDPFSRRAAKRSLEITMGLVPFPEEPEVNGLNGNGQETSVPKGSTLEVVALLQRAHEGLPPGEPIGAYRDPDAPDHHLRDTPQYLYDSTPDTNHQGEQ